MAATVQVALFSAKHDDRKFFRLTAKRMANQCKFEFKFFEALLNKETAAMAQGVQIVVPFVNDVLNREVLTLLHQGGTRLIAMRCAGFNNVDLLAAAELGLKVVRVPAYSPYAVAEHAMALVLTLNRKIHKAVYRVREGNFNLRGLLGFDLNGRTVGVIGTGKIGEVFCRICKGFGMTVLAYDPYPNPALKGEVEYVSLDRIYAESDVISLHCPLLKDNEHMLNKAAFAKMKPGVLIINTSRGALIDTKDVIPFLKNGRIGGLGLDVYENESALFFEDQSIKQTQVNPMLQDDLFERLLSFPNVIITGHQAFFTSNALTNIADTTLENVLAFVRGDKKLVNEVPVPRAKL